MIYLLTTERQTVNYYSTIHALELIYFDSNTQETMKKKLYPSDSSNFPPLHCRYPAKSLTVTKAFACISYVLMRENDVAQSNVKETKTDVIKLATTPGNSVVCFRPVILLQNRTRFFTILGEVC